MAFTGATLQAWYASTGVNITTIGLLSLAGQPYVFKFLWAPLLDRYPLFFFSRKQNAQRKNWILMSQVVLTGCFVLMSFLHPQQTPLILALMALLLGFASATHDIAIDAYRTDALPPSQRGFGVAVSVAGYRIAMLVSGGIILIVADYHGWQTALMLMALLMLGCFFISWFAPAPLYHVEPPRSLSDAVSGPFKEFMQRQQKPSIVWFLLFIILYKLGDAFAGSLTTTFLLRGVGFSLTEIGFSSKTVGLAATLAGVFIGGLFLYRFGLYRALLVFGLFQAFTNLGFVWMAGQYQNFWAMVGIISLENLAGGMGTAAFVALLTGLCHHRYSATQFAMFSALAALGRVYAGPLAGWGVEWMGWQNFYVFSFVIALPGLLMLYYLKTPINYLEEVNKK